MFELRNRYYKDRPDGVNLMSRLPLPNIAATEILGRAALELRMQWYVSGSMRDTALRTLEHAIEHLTQQRLREWFNEGHHL